MVLEDGIYEPRTEDEILSQLETELRQTFGEDIDLTESSVFSRLAEVMASVTSQNQEQSLQKVYQSAFLDTAEGESLDAVVSIIGINRRSAIHATGVERFRTEDPVEQTYTIQSGTSVQTQGDDPVQFETSEPTSLLLVDSFEDGNLNDYSGDVSNASVVADANAPQGDNAVELDAADAHIYSDDTFAKRGSQFHVWMNPSTNTAPAVTFGIEPTEPSTRYQVTLDHAADECRIECYDEGVVVNTIDVISNVGITAGEYHKLDINWSTTGSIGVTVYDSSDDETELASGGGTCLRHNEGYCGFKSEDTNGTKRIDFYTSSATSANIRATVGGVRGNVGSNSLTKMPSPPAGVDNVTNLYPTGTTDYIDTDGRQFSVGEEREDDEQLRNRAQDAVAGGGAATHDALVETLVNETEGVTSVTVFENKTDVNNTGSGGLPPYSFEAVVFGGDDEDVARTIHETKAITSRDYGGVNGDETNVTITAKSNGQLRDITFSRPTEVDIDMTLDIVVDDNYIGDERLKDQIVSYIGGTLSNGTEVVGLGVADNVRLDRLRDEVIDDNSGVVGFDQSVDGSPIETTPSITIVDGLEVVDIGESEVAQTDASDTSIVINKRQQS